MRVQLVMIRLSAAPRALDNFLKASWGSAPLHPRLYAIAALRGLSTKDLYHWIRASLSTRRRPDESVL
jgi:hypothetical protein